jgi:hypothetical protein
MMNRLIACSVLALSLAVVTGCYSTQEGRLKPGMPFTKDSITSRYEAPLTRIHEAAVAVIKKNGTLTNDDKVTNVLRGIVDAKTVWIKLDDTEPKITKIIIQVRSGGGAADVETASEIDKQIYGYLLTGK